MKNFSNNFLNFNIIFLKSKVQYRFIAIGIITTFLTNILLQIFITLLPLWIATFFSQLFNLVFGFYAYSYLVFKVKKTYFWQFKKFTFLALLTWQLNHFFIDLIFNYLNVNIRIAALLTIPILALFSFFFQKKFIY